MTTDKRGLNGRAEICPVNPMLSAVIWGGATAFTVSVIGMAVVVVVSVWMISGRRAGLQRAQ